MGGTGEVRWAKVLPRAAWVRHHPRALVPGPAWGSAAPTLASSQGKGPDGAVRCQPRTGETAG